MGETYPHRQPLIFLGRKMAKSMWRGVLWKDLHNNEQQRRPQQPPPQRTELTEASMRLLGLANSFKGLEVQG